MKKINIILIVFTCVNLSIAQISETSKGIWFTVENPNNLNVPQIIDGIFVFEDEELNDFFNGHGITKFSLALPSLQESTFKNVNNLDRVYEIQCECDIFLLKGEMEEYFSSSYTNIESIPEYELLYTPNDYTLLDGQFGSNWQLDLIQAKEAWDITHGSSQINVAIVEVPFQSTGVNNYDLIHEDLTDNIVYNNDNTANEVPHGTFVAGCASAVTNNNKGISSPFCT